MGIVGSSTVAFAAAVGNRDAGGDGDAAAAAEGNESAGENGGADDSEEAVNCTAVS